MRNALEIHRNKLVIYDTILFSDFIFMSIVPLFFQYYRFITRKALQLQTPVRFLGPPLQASSRASTLSPNQRRSFFFVIGRNVVCNWIIAAIIALSYWRLMASSSSQKKGVKAFSKVIIYTVRVLRSSRQ